MYTHHFTVPMQKCYHAKVLALHNNNSYQPKYKTIIILKVRDFFFSVWQKTKFKHFQRLWLYNSFFTDLLDCENNDRPFSPNFQRPRRNPAKTMLNWTPHNTRQSPPFKKTTHRQWRHFIFSRHELHTHSQISCWTLSVDKVQAPWVNIQQVPVRGKSCVQTL